MLFDNDYVLQIAAAGVLEDMGGAGRQALAAARTNATDTRTKLLLDDSLKEMDATA